ncbi:sulfite exporter TauE/SafE family protein [Guptibacillus algicola]|uniref:urease accessory protein UreH domain-containing protein n=1 Tax=Guptibacillus algicola TaxID=225844 RepID=UPI001CD2C36A|nr:sulfite exporter TauE/SafE family protein [Alkalihalobacillus algicola]MCA0987299.1 sulfite exporter TauE/SafE family protein [Alkalihalobacillus algicola]
MVSSLTSVLLVGLILGIKHAIEPDHVIAVSTVASNTKKWWRSSFAGIFWGIGHTATLFIVGIMVIALKGTIPEGWSLWMEVIVGVMLVYLGFKSMIVARKEKVGQVNDKRSPYLKSVVIGSIHGLAGSGALVLLTISSVDHIWEGALYILVFGLGTVIGMLFFTTVLAIPFLLSKSKSFHYNLTRFAGLVSVLFGVYYMYSVW